MRIASIDAGTNTLRLLIAEQTGREGDKFRAVERQRFVTGLGTSLARTGKFGTGEMDATLIAFKKFAGQMRKMNVVRYFAAGTQAFREASNTNVFTDIVFEQSGIKVSVIDAGLEAELSYAGIVDILGTAMTKRSVIIDIGGGSTEIMRGPARRGKWVSTNIGVLRMVSLFSPMDPPEPWELKNMRHYVRDRLLAARREIGARKAEKVIGTAGTYTTIAAMYRKIPSYDPDRINGTRLTRNELRTLADKLYRMKAERRIGVTGMEKGRELLIVPGLIVAEEAMDVFSAEATLVSDGSLLEGIIEAMQKRKIKGEVYEEPEN